MNDGYKIKHKLMARWDWACKYYLSDVNHCES